MQSLHPVAHKAIVRLAHCRVYGKQPLVERRKALQTLRSKDLHCRILRLRRYPRLSSRLERNRRQSSGSLKIILPFADTPQTIDDDFT